MFWCKVNSFKLRAEVLIMLFTAIKPTCNFNPSKHYATVPAITSDSDLIDIWSWYFYPPDARNSICEMRMLNACSALAILTCTELTMFFHVMSKSLETPSEGDFSRKAKRVVFEVFDRLELDTNVKRSIVWMCCVWGRHFDVSHNRLWLLSKPKMPQKMCNFSAACLFSSVEEDANGIG